MLNQGKKKSKLGLWIGIVIVLAVIIVVVAVVQSSKPKVGKYNTFAQCLDAAGLKMYGSATCSFCARQRDLFGPSFEYINEVECDPRNAGNESERCIAKDITHTPTWIQEDEDGNELYRFEAGVVPLEDLSAFSGCELVEDSI